MRDDCIEPDDELGCGDPWCPACGGVDGSDIWDDAADDESDLEVDTDDDQD